MELIKDRLLHYIRQKGMSVREFERRCGFSNGYLNNIRELRPDKAECIYEVFPDLDRVWLLTGKEPEPKSSGTLAEGANQHLVPLVPEKAWGGTLSNYAADGIERSKCEFYNVPMDVDLLIPVAGNSMAPEFCSGDIVGVKRINHASFIEWGKVYVLDTPNGIVVKEVQPGSHEGCVTCVSRNEPERFKPFEVSLAPEELFGMFQVKGVIRRI